MGKPIEKKDYEKRYQSARWDIMLLIALTVINLGVMLFGDNLRYVSSAAIPLSLVALGKIMCGKMDNEFYVGKYAGIEFLDDGFMIGMIAVAIVIIGIYVFLHQFAKCCHSSTPLLICMGFHKWILLQVDGNVKICLWINPVRSHASSCLSGNKSGKGCR